MAFAIKELRTGQYRTFSLREVLKLLGDSVNDEILIGDQPYSISSCREVGAEGAGTHYQIDWISFQLEIQDKGENTFYFPDEIVDTDSLFLTVNNVHYQYGERFDYHIQADRLFWHGPFDLEAEDRVILRYPKTIS